MGWLLAVSAFTAAGLAFMVEPIVARLLLPGYGGSAAVWTTALAFFQVTLVLGYAWAHVAPRWLGVRGHAAAQAGLVVAGLIVLPVGLPAWAPPPADVPAAAWLTATLAAMIGLPFFVLATNGPTVQRWFAELRDRAGDDAYRLFAASNAGSLLGLLAYPVVVEPNLELVDQATVWAAGFGFLAVLTIAAAWWAARRPFVAAPGSRETDVAAQEPRAGMPSTRRQRLRWLALAAVPAALMVGVTSHLSVDVAAVPFLWVVPLSIYLVSLILAFARRRPILAGPARLVLVPVVIVTALVLTDWLVLPILWEFAVHLTALLVAGLALHGDLADARPPVARVTEYNVLVALGGAIGGLAAGIIGPIALPLPLEEHVALVAAVALLLAGAAGRRAAIGPRNALIRIAAPTVPAVLALGLLAGSLPSSTTLITVRSFYGTYRVVDDGAGRHVLYAGTTIHGIQDLTPGMERVPGSYYSRRGPLGQVLAGLIEGAAPLRIGAVGLGSGAVAAYGRPGDAVEFLEIDPAVAAIAADPRLFTYLADSAADVSVTIGDGRLLLATRPPGTYDILVADAFSSDAIPVHLLTVEGLATQMRSVRDGGVIALHISNRYLDLEPVVAAAARDLGFVSIVGSTLTPADEVGRSQASQWVVVGRAYRDVAGLVGGGDWRTAHAAERKAWTDRFSDLLGALRRA